MKRRELLTRQTAANLRCIPAMPTVFASNGLGPHDAAIDWKQQGSLIDFLLQQCRNDAILVAGTTGEPATMSHNEQSEYITWVIDRVDGSAPVIAGTGANCTLEAVELTNHAIRAGASAALLVKPYYNNPTPAGLLAHFRAIGKTSAPFVSYSVSYRTGGTPIPISVILELANEFPNFIGHKEAEGDANRFAQLRQQCPKDFNIWSGDDGITAEVMAAGNCNGVISVASNITNLVKAMVDASATGQMAEAWLIYRTLETLFGKQGLFLETNPLGVKHALALMGVIKQACFRLPLVPMREENVAALRQVLQSLKLIPGAN